MKNLKKLKENIMLKNRKNKMNNSKKPYTDDELKDILSFSPTENNLKLLAEKYGRTASSLKDIYRWANYTKKHLKKRGKWNGFTKQIKKCCAEIRLMKLP